MYLQLSLKIVENIKFWFFKLQSKQKESKKNHKERNQLERKRPLGIWSEEEETDVQCKKTTHGVN